MKRMEGTIQLTLSHSDAMTVLHALAEANRGIPERETTPPGERRHPPTSEQEDATKRTWVAQRLVGAVIQQWPELGEFKMEPGSAVVTVRR